MAAFDLALSRVRDGSDDLLVPARINQLARAGGRVFRQTTLTPGNTLRLFAQQIACGNIACSAVHHLAGKSKGSGVFDVRRLASIRLAAMPRRLRVSTGGLAYHVLNRAVGRGLIFDDDGGLSGHGARHRAHLRTGCPCASSATA